MTPASNPIKLAPSRGRPGKPVTIQGTAYPSRTAAAKALGVTTGTVSQALREGWEDSIGKGPLQRSKPITIQGVTYPSRTAAAKALGLSPNTVSHVAKYGDLDKLGTRKQHKAEWRGPVTLNTTTFPDRSTAAKTLKVSRRDLTAYLTVQRALKRYLETLPSVEKEGNADV